ncbi:winged helix-turn-helix domain-containing protein [Arthrobacter sp. PO-11]|uniref:Winged helix-turn-helix domain-containing protein n=1 Tax=Arthrobacter cavernae TaxID=2817681 RepID=A0A939KKN1_9MICC|nr:winged helix-turn-helix domain-containing protein [Arthrobacter cavernae]
MELPATSVGRLLRQLGLSVQEPLYRSYQADPEGRWRGGRASEYPAIAASARAAGGRGLLRR